MGIVTKVFHTDGHKVFATRMKMKEERVETGDKNGFRFIQKLIRMNDLFFSVSVF